MMIEITTLAVLVTTIMSTLLSHGFEVLVALITRIPERVSACAFSIISLLDVFDDGKQHSMKIYRSWIGTYLISLTRVFSVLFSMGAVPIKPVATTVTLPLALLSSSGL